MKHFIDHYIRVLPKAERPKMQVMKTDMSPFSSMLSSPSQSPDPIKSKPQIAKHLENPEIVREINKEIEECVNSIGNLSPLLPDFGYGSFGEIGIAIVGVTISFSFKCLAAKSSQSQIKKLLKLKNMYVDWIQATIDKYKLNKTRVYEYNKLIKDYLAKVNES